MGAGEEVGDYEGCGAGFSHCAGEDVSEAAWILWLGRKKQGMEIGMDGRRQDIRELAEKRRTGRSMESRREDAR